MEDELIAKIVTRVIKEANIKTKMNLKIAKELMEVVSLKATELGIAVVIAVSDNAARPVAVHCMDDAYIGSYDIALNKTFTAVGFKMSTQQLGQLSQPGQSLYGIQFTNDGKVIIFGGGEPLVCGENIVGALGVSGGSAEQDTFLAAYGKKIFEEVISCK